MTDIDHAKLRDLAAGEIGLYRTEIGEALVADLLANMDGWRSGHDAADDCYWCSPETADGRMVRGISGAPWVCRWGGAEFQALKGI